MDINKKNENGYDLTAVLFTPDKGISGDRGVVGGFLGEGDATWQHSPMGEKHEVTFTQCLRRDGGGTDTQAFRIF